MIITIVEIKITIDGINRKINTIEKNELVSFKIRLINGLKIKQQKNKEIKEIKVFFFFNYLLSR